ncbi:MAG: M20 family peptidase [Dehalococcoidia bacterium]|nr:MAG: M20 family peptidase [Dehalococcoidia bacterium]
MELEGLKTKLRNEVDARRQELVQLSLKIHDNPELSFEEKRASSWLIDFLGSNGFRVRSTVAGLPTAFQATYGQGSPRIALLAEYDALPQIGHGCGHNIIAASAVGAGVASKLAIDQLGGTIVVLGTPGEEGFGGKIDMVEAGVFEEIDVAMMVHPNTRNMVTTEMLACTSLEVEFIGKPAHAAAQPYKGVNALEALILAFNSVNSLRQHIKAEARIHGIITDGGQVPNIVPAHSAAKFLIRALDKLYLDELKEKVLNCFKGASLATGAKLEYNWGERSYSPMKNNVTLAELFGENLQSLGRHVEAFDPRFGFGSTDMGNVSQVVPSVHPSVAIAAPEVVIHTPEFAQAAASEAGHEGLLDAAKAMAATVVDILDKPETLDKIKQEFYSSHD